MNPFFFQARTSSHIERPQKIKMYLIHIEQPQKNILYIKIMSKIIFEKIKKKMCKKTYLIHIPYPHRASPENEKRTLFTRAPPENKKLI